jgi:acylphosphatase
MKVRAHILVSGQVQGVLFRSETRHIAASYGVKGWVRNLPDGRVEAVLEGDRDAVEKTLDFCRQGPPGAHVGSVDVKWEDPKGEDGFEVKT